MNEHASEEETFSTEFLEHVVRARSQYDETCRRMAVEILRHRKVADSSGVMQDDMTALMRVLGIGTHARPTSPHHVMVEEVIPAVQRLVSEGRPAASALDLHDYLACVSPPCTNVGCHYRGKGCDAPACALPLDHPIHVTDQLVQDVLDRVRQYGPDDYERVLVSLREQLSDLRTMNAVIVRNASQMRCREHAKDASNAWGCPGCVADLRGKLASSRVLLLGIHEALGNVFWTSDDGETQRTGEPEDEDVPEPLLTQWRALRDLLGLPLPTPPADLITTHAYKGDDRCRVGATQLDEGCEQPRKKHAR